MSDATRPRLRPAPQRSRRVLAVAALAIVLATGAGALLAHGRHRETPVIERILALEGGLGLEPIVGAAWVNRMPDRARNYLIRVVRVDVSCLPIDTTDLARLRNLRWLESLDLWYTGVDDTSLRELRGLERLRHLDLSETAVTDAGLAGLAERLPRLRLLDLSGTRVTDAGIAHLGELDELERLYVAGTAVTTTGLEHLRRRLPALVAGDPEQPRR